MPLTLNQLLSQGLSSYQYDANGNRNFISNGSENLQCLYDTLDRLIEVVKGSVKVKFEYDAFHRRMSKRVFKMISNQWCETSFEKYMYAMDVEIGSVDSHGAIKELKIIGQNIAAIELDDKIFLPIQDHRGNIVTLARCDDKAIVETYRYSAYGEESIFDSNGDKIVDSQNPWRFSGKRVDVETGWSYFGRRYYDPEVGKWTGPDPIWFEDGTNLYAYVHNSPLNYIDPNGLFTSSINNYAFDVWNSPRFQGACQMFTGAAEMGAGGVIASGSYGMAAPLGLAITTHGADHFCTGLRTVISGRNTDTVTCQLIQKTGVSEQTAQFMDNTFSACATMGATAYRFAHATTFSSVSFAQEAKPFFQRIPQSFGKSELILPKNEIRNSLAYSPKSGMDLQRHLRYCERYGTGEVKFLNDGRVRYYGIIESPRTSGEMIGRRYVHEFNSMTGRTRGWNETLDSKFYIRQVRPQLRTIEKRHYFFDALGNLETIW